MSSTRFLASTMPEALAAARRELGADLHILHAATHRTGGLWPFGRVIEAEVIAEPRMVVAHVDPQSAPAASPRRAPAPRSARRPELQLRVAARLALAQAVAAAHGAAQAAIAEADEALAQARSSDVHGTPQVVPALMRRMTARLRAQGLNDTLIAQVSSRVLADLNPRSAHEPEASAGHVRACFVNAVASLLPVAECMDACAARPEGRPRVIAVVGPTGVGKTTTVAKMAADCRMRLGLRVGIVAADGFRVGAVDQLQAYAQILGAPMRAADTPAAVRTAMLDLAWCDVILIDTAGRSHRDAARIAEINAVLRAARPDDTHLVLSGAASPRALREAATAFQQTQPTRVVLSKLDECETPGALVQAVRDSGCPVSWFTTGQEVPDDIERASAEAFAARVVDGVSEGETGVSSGAAA